MIAKDMDLLDYACDKFEAGAYDEALEAFVLAYSKGYEREWVLENIYNCYMNGNEAEFREAFKSIPINYGMAYEDCTLDFVPYLEGRYFIFDRGIKAFRGIFSTLEVETSQIPEGIAQKPFSDLAVAMDWDWREALFVLRCAKERKVYVVSADIPRILSFCKIPELHEYLANVRIFPDYEKFQGYFHQHPSIYLPRIWVGCDEDQREFANAVNAEHAWRLTPEGRLTGNILLTIAIPTYERGKLLLRRIENLRKMTYDAEIEVTISKNGTHLYQEEYEEASKRVEGDARFLYHDHGKELHYEQNWHYAAEMAHGRYVMFVSDEDDVMIENLDHYLKLLQDHPEASVVRAWGIGPNFSKLEKQTHAKKGIEAFYVAFLNQNYLSGMIFRREDFLGANLMSLLRYRTSEEKNEFYCNYPHEWWCASLVQVGDYIVEPLPLIMAGKTASEIEKEEKDCGIFETIQKDAIGASQSGQITLPNYSTYEDRLKQFQDELGFLRIYFQEQEVYWYVGLDNIIWKLFWLIGMTREYHYEPEHFLDIVSECAKRSKEAVQEAPITEEHQKMILEELEGYIAESVELHKRLCEKEESATGAEQSVGFHP